MAERRTSSNLDLHVDAPALLEDATRRVGADINSLVHAKHADGRPYPKHACPVHRTIVEGLACRLANEALWRADGTWFPAEYSSHPIIEDGHGGRCGRRVLRHQPAPRRRAEAPCPEERWRLTLDHAPIGIAIGVVVAEPDIPTSAMLAAADAAMYAYKRAHLR